MAPNKEPKTLLYLAQDRLRLKITTLLLSSHSSEFKKQYIKNIEESLTVDIGNQLFNSIVETFEMEGLNYAKGLQYCLNRRTTTFHCSYSLFKHSFLYDALKKCQDLQVLDITDDMQTLLNTKHNSKFIPMIMTLKNLKILIIDDYINEDILDIILSSCQFLQNLNAKNCKFLDMKKIKKIKQHTALQKLTLRCSFRTNNKIIGYLFSKFPQLLSFHYDNSGKVMELLEPHSSADVPKFKYLPLTDISGTIKRSSELLSIVKLCPDLKSINFIIENPSDIEILTDVKQLMDISIKFYLFSNPHFSLKGIYGPNLCTLALNSASNILLSEILEHCPNLEELSLNSCFSLNMVTLDNKLAFNLKSFTEVSCFWRHTKLLEFLSNCHNLAYLKICHTQITNEEIVKSLIDKENYKNLNTLILIGGDPIPLETLSFIIEEFPKLKNLHLPETTHPDDYKRINTFIKNNNFHCKCKTEAKFL